MELQPNVLGGGICLNIRTMRVSEEKRAIWGQLTCLVIMAPFNG